MEMQKQGTRTRPDETIDQLAIALYDIGAIYETTMRELSSLKISPLRDLAPGDISG